MFLNICKSPSVCVFLTKQCVRQEQKMSRSNSLKKLITPVASVNTPTGQK